MRAHYFSKTILLSCLLAICAGQADAQVVICVAESGEATYTNQACENEADAVRGLALSNPVAVKARPVRPAEMLAASWEAREGAAVTYRAGKPKAAPDLDTMKAARASLQAMDKASPFAHPRNLVALDLRNPGWFDFR